MFQVKTRRTPYQSQANEADMGIPCQVYSKDWESKCFELVDDQEQPIEDEKEALKEMRKQFGRKGEGIDWLLDNGLIVIEFNNQTGAIRRTKRVDKPFGL
jgi:hypothetical protein